MTVYERELVREVAAAPAVEEDASGERIFSERIGTQVGRIIFSLHNGVIDIRAVYSYPAYHIISDRRTGCGCGIGRIRLVSQDTSVKSMCVHIVIVIDLPYSDQHYKAEKYYNEPAVYLVEFFPEAEQGGQSSSDFFFFI